MESHTADENFVAALAHLGVILPFWGLVAAYQAFQGCPYRYPLIGHRLDRFNQ